MSRQQNPAVALLVLTQCRASSSADPISAMNRTVVTERGKQGTKEPRTRPMMNARVRDGSIGFRRYGFTTDYVRGNGNSTKVGRDDSCQPIGLFANQTIAFAFDHDAQHRFSPGIANENAPAAVEALFTFGDRLMEIRDRFQIRLL